MEKVNVSLKIDGKIKYESKGVGTLNRDILKFRNRFSIWLYLNSCFKMVYR